MPIVDLVDQHGQHRGGADSQTVDEVRNARAIYHDEDGKWYRHDHVFQVQNIQSRGKLTPPSNPLDVGVVAATYPEAFETLYGYPVPMPDNPRTSRKSRGEE
jgi:hypothetical protein